MGKAYSKLPDEEGSSSSSAASGKRSTSEGPADIEHGESATATQEAQLRRIVCVYGGVVLFIGALAGTLFGLMLCQKLPTAGSFTTNQIDKLQKAFYQSRANTTFQDFLGRAGADRVPESPAPSQAVDGCVLQGTPRNVYKGIIASSYSYDGDTSYSYQDKSPGSYDTSYSYDGGTSASPNEDEARRAALANFSKTMSPFAHTYFDAQCIIANGTGDPCDLHVADT